MKIEHKLTIPFIFIAIGNLIDCIYRGSPFIDYLAYVFLFIPVIIFLLIAKIKIKDKPFSFILLGLSCLGFWFGGDSSLIGTTLLCFSFYLSDNKKKTIYSYVGIITVLILAKFTITKQNPAQMAVFLAGSSFIFIFYHHYMHPVTSKYSKMDIGQKVDTPDDILEIMKHRLNGLSYKQIPELLEYEERPLTPAAIGQKVNRYKEKIGVENNEELLLYLIKNKSIRLESDDDAFI